MACLRSPIGRAGVSGAEGEVLSYENQPPGGLVPPEEQEACPLQRNHPESFLLQLESRAEGGGCLPQGQRCRSVEPGSALSSLH